MKRLLLTIYGTILILVCGACKKSISAEAEGGTTKCDPVALPYQFRNIFLSDPIPNSNEVKALAVFKFKQSMKSFASTPCKNLSNVCETKLDVQNVSGRRMRLAYSVEYSQGNNNWSSDGFVDVLPDSTIEVGVISSNCGWITAEGLRVNKRSVTLE